MYKVKIDPYEINLGIADKDKFWTMCSEQNVLKIVKPVLKMKMTMKNLYTT